MKLFAAISIVAFFVLARMVAPTSAQDPRLARADARFAEAMQLWSGGPSPRIEELLQSALDDRYDVLGPNDPAVVQVVNQLGRLYFNRRDYDRAITQFRNAVFATDRPGAPESVALSIYLGDLGAALREARYLGEAESVVGRALAIRRARLAPDDALIAGSLNNLGRIYLAQQRWTEAAGAFSESHRIYERQLGPDAPLTRQQTALLADARAGGRQGEVAFDFRWSGYALWWMPMACMLVFAIAWAGVLRSSPAAVHWRTAGAWSVLVLASLTTGGLLAWTMGETRRVMLAMHDGSTVFAEGAVAQLEHQAPWPGRELGSFALGGATFHYDSYAPDSSFVPNRGAADALQEGRRLRIGYIGNAIVSVESRP